MTSRVFVQARYRFSAIVTLEPTLAVLYGVHGHDMMSMSARLPKDIGPCAKSDIVAPGYMSFRASLRMRFDSVASARCASRPRLRIAFLTAKNLH